VDKLAEFRIPMVRHRGLSAEERLALFYPETDKDREAFFDTLES
jgi:hypothetical protein